MVYAVFYCWNLDLAAWVRQSVLMRSAPNENPGPQVCVEFHVCLGKRTLKCMSGFLYTHIIIRTSSFYWFCHLMFHFNTSRVWVCLARVCSSSWIIETGDGLGLLNKRSNYGICGVGNIVNSRRLQEINILVLSCKLIFYDQDLCAFE